MFGVWGFRGSGLCLGSWEYAWKEGGIFLGSPGPDGLSGHGVKCPEPFNLKIDAQAEP